MIPTVLPTQVRQLIAQGAIVAVNHSGGKDSQAMLIVLRNMGVPDSQIRIVHAVLDEVDWEGIPEHIQANSFGLPFTMRANPTSFFQKVEARGMFPSPKQRWCTSDLKRGPLDALIRIACPKGSIVIDCEGLRAEESAERAKKAAWELGTDKQQGGGRTWFKWRPILEMTEAEVFQVIRDAGQEPHWAYAAGMTRLSCCFCIMSSRGDLKTAAQLKPELARRYAALERRIGHTLAMPDNQGRRQYLDEILDLKPALPLAA